ncbi:hypothetical protein NM208_g3624 [Fusarium decemcellulare]|uniref:Uncharacterized protein n=1 Tax=Fusarium decemcellulare TaxID=57161 RepID=A0ACC1SNG1_9HYPO|nr:hypothetical protein NM208_g3624 [Fusarium decemcellulare]
MEEASGPTSPQKGSSESRSSGSPAISIINGDPAVDGTPTSPTETIQMAPIDGDDLLESESGSKSPAPVIINPRAYQREMLEQSLERNVIVAMDTGSGKTQVAVLRIQAELERCSPEKIIWFLGKTVSLCEQQFKVIHSQMPAVSMKLLTGQLNIDAWSPEVWPRILDGTRIVVSTFDILRDALDHAFVKMDMLALIVFDEVHNCVKNSSGRKIMMNFYHDQKIAGKPVPSILGLTASPVISSNLASIETLETTMDAICITPTIHREELLKCVNKPHLVRSIYDFAKHPERTRLMKELQTAYIDMDITKDPDVLKVARSSMSEEDRRQRLSKVIMKHDTFSQNQMKGLWSRSKEILSELGSWAADQYISELVGIFLKRLDSPQVFADSWSNEDRSYLAGYLRKVSVACPVRTTPMSSELSHKASRLIHELIAAGDGVVGIIFVKERAIANVMCQLLNEFPPVQKRYRIGTMVGTSSHGQRKRNMYEFDNGGSTKVLEQFRSGEINLLVATSVLEEGIDVPACNLVVCFDATTTLRSFIQRRGRARMQESKMIALESTNANPRTWNELEEAMKTRYQDDQRELQRLNELADSEATSSIHYTVKPSGARLDFENARQHLEHFCQVVFRADYADRRPDYIFRKEESYGGELLRATVTLPSGLPAHLRKFRSGCAWKSEKNAMKDAAFRAYVALYEEGLVSNNLLPMNLVPEDVEQILDLKAEPLFNPWVPVAQKWQQTEDRWLYTFDFFDEELADPSRFQVVLPVKVSQLRDIKIYPHTDYEWAIKFVSAREISHNEAATLPDHTSTLLALHYGHRWKVEDCDHVVKFVYETNDLSKKQIGAVPFRDSERNIAIRQFLIRDRGGSPFHYLSTIPSKPLLEEVQNPFYEYANAPQDQPYLVVKKWSRRADLLHPINESDQPPKASTKPYGRVLPISWATVDAIPRRVVKLGMLLPSIIHELEVQLIATELSSTLLKPVGITNLQLVLEAISCRSAIEPVDYERLEFLGDSILKYCTVIQAFAEHPHWPEGLLVHFKDRLVSNARLHRACLESGLSKFILSKSFTGQKWKPLYLDKFLQEGAVEQPERNIGQKPIADVVEALIGASFQDGGMQKALRCISVFLGEKCHWHQDGRARQILFDMAPSDVPLPPTLAPLEELIGYSFQKKALLVEAITHGSYAGDTHQRSYEQLEFLGDAVLDYIVVTKMFNWKPAIPNSRLHMIKTALVNGEFLSFVNMEHNVRRRETKFKAEGVVEDTETSLSLWKFMRFTSPDIGREQDKVTARFETLRGEILEALQNGTHYPWALLSRFQPKKFYSDLMEALIGAVWVDSDSIQECEDVVRRFGILPYLERVLRDSIHIQHPKEELSVLSGAKKVEYNYTVINGVVPEYSCVVKVGDRVVGDITGATNKLEAMTKAAQQAVELLTREKRAAKVSVELMDVDVDME